LRHPESTSHKRLDWRKAMDTRNIKAACFAFTGTALFYTAFYLLITLPGRLAG